MGSHYIKVGNIKFDQNLLDIVCPAAGYTPELICPAAGYIPEPGQPFVPPIDVGTPPSGQITLLCQNTGFRIVRFQTYVTTGKVVFDVYDSGNNFIETSSEYSSGAAASYDLSGYPDNALIIIKIRPTLGDITRWFVSQSSSYGGADYPILQIKFNTPELTSLEDAFMQLKMIKDIKFESTVEKLADMESAFERCGLEYWKPSANFAALTTLRYAFRYSDIVKLDLSDSAMPALTDMYYCFAYIGKGYKISLPASLPLVENMQYALREAVLEELVMPTSAPSVTSYQGFLYESFVKGEVNIPESQQCTTVNYFARYAKFVEKIIFNGHWPNLSNMSYAFQTCERMTHLTFPRTVGSTSVAANLNTVTGSNFELREVVLPDTLYLTSVSSIIAYPQSKIRSVTGNCNALNQLVSGPEISNAANLEVFDIPNAKYGRLWLATSTSAPKLTHVNIDWANSTWDSLSYVPMIKIQANLDATEIDRIFGLLPTVVDGQAIDLSSNPGFAGCAPAIAQAKGWTVYGA